MHFDTTPNPDLNKTLWKTANLPTLKAGFTRMWEFFQHSLGLCDLKSTFLKETNKKWETTRILLIFSVMKIYCKILSNEIKA